MVAKRWLLLLLMLPIISGCSMVEQQEIYKIALLAPFEGRYREIGYDALYAARLAFADSATDNLDLLAIDDGGSVETAIDRAYAIQKDPAIKLTLVLGLQASDEQVQIALGNHPVIIIGHWNATPTGENVVMLANRNIDSQLSAAQPASVTSIAPVEETLIGSELLALKQVPALVEDLTQITIMSSATLPDEDFTERYLASDSFVPEPGLLTTLSYDATRLAIISIQREQPLRQTVYEGINRSIQFDADGYWLDAPIHEYHYENGKLTSID